jgi:diacylglycerol kinase family enzyme
MKAVNSSHFSERSAFLLNANAKGVSRRLADQLAEIVPAGDLFFSRSLQDAEMFASTIMRRGYSQVFTGGGDGTVVSTVNLLSRAAKQHGDGQLPQMGVLRLGTGNAMASTLGAKRALLDAHHVVNGGATDLRPMRLVECDDGTLTPFAGMGYDGEVLNDYLALKKAARHPLAARLTNSVWGYLGAMLLRSVPRQFTNQTPTITVRSSQDAYRVIREEGKDVEVKIAAGTVLYEGPASTVSVGAIPYYGYKFTMFPFAEKREGHLNFRVVGGVSIPKILANLYPAVWRGTFRHPGLHDFLVKDVEIEGSAPLPFQVGGDGAGYRQKVRFSAAKEALPMIELGKRLIPAKGPFGFLPPMVPARTR